MIQTAHKHLEVYKATLRLVKEIYDITKRFPGEERFGLTMQIRRAMVSVCSNIAAGAARKNTADRKRFYEIARSSLVEVDTQLEIALLVEFIKKEHSLTAEDLLLQVFKMLSKMISTLSS